MEISDLLSSLSESDIEQLKETAASLLGGFGGGDADKGNESSALAAPAIDAGLIKTISSVGGMMNKPDARCDFLLALKPLLKEDHRDRAEQAAKMLRLMNALPILKDSGILKGLF